MDDAEISDIFAGLGPVSIRRMFGGKGVYHRGRIVAIDLGDEIVLKADAVSAPAFAAVGAARWTYAGRRGKPVAMPYWSVPADAFDDPDLMARWVRLAYEAALRTSADGAGSRGPKAQIP